MHKTNKQKLLRFRQKLGRNSPHDLPTACHVQLLNFIQPPVRKDNVSELEFSKEKVKKEIKKPKTC